MSKWCCMRLTTAGISIGICGLVFSAISLIMIASRLYSEANYVSASPEGACANLGFLCFRSGRMLTASFLTILMGMIPYVLLIHGSIKENHLFLLPWLILKGCALGIAAYRIFFAWQWERRKWVVELIVLLVYALSCYIWYVIFLLYKQLKLQRDQKKLVEIKSLQQTSIPYQKNDSSISV